MTARVLAVDDVRSNLKLLQSRLSLEYFEGRDSDQRSRHSGRGVIGEAEIGPGRGLGFQKAA